MTYFLLRNISQISEEIWKLCENNLNSNDLVFFLESSWEIDGAQERYNTNQGSGVGAVNEMVPFLPFIVPFFFEPYVNNMRMRGAILEWTRGRAESDGMAGNECGEMGGASSSNADNSASYPPGIPKGGQLAAGTVSLEDIIKYYREHPEELD